jgi:hypothetical protein
MREGQARALRGGDHDAAPPLAGRRTPRRALEERAVEDHGEHRQGGMDEGEEDERTASRATSIIAAAARRHRLASGSSGEMGGMALE